MIQPDFLREIYFTIIKKNQFHEFFLFLGVTLVWLAKSQVVVIWIPEPSIAPCQRRRLKATPRNQTHHPSQHHFLCHCDSDIYRRSSFIGNTLQPVFSQQISKNRFLFLNSICNKFFQRNKILFYMTALLLMEQLTKYSNLTRLFWATRIWDFHTPEEVLPFLTWRQIWWKKNYLFFSWNLFQEFVLIFFLIIFSVKSISRKKSLEYFFREINFRKRINPKKIYDEK